MNLTKAQRQALKVVYDRIQPATSYLQFRRTVRGAFFDSCIMVPVGNGVWSGIETDGHTHQ